MATAWCLNLPVMLSFAQRLFAHNPQELWRRWRISLGRLLFMDDDTTRLLSKLGNFASIEAWRADLTPDALRAFVEHVAAMPQTKAGLVACSRPRP